MFIHNEWIKIYIYIYIYMYICIYTHTHIYIYIYFPGGSMVKNLPAMQETCV